ncbi:MAG TPA: hypothetical protein VGE04_05020 [Chloroflexia bacterium]
MRNSGVVAAFIAGAVILSAVLVQSVIAAPPVGTRLNILWRVKPGGDYMTTTASGERNAFPPADAVAYVPANNVSSTSALYRLLRAGDHMDSLTAGEAGYSTEGILGYPFSTSTAVQGLGQLYRYVNGVGDHALGRPDESGAFAAKGYTTVQPLNAWAYPRFNRTTDSMLAISGGGVTLESNAVAGGALWHWTWNGNQFVNNRDYGRQIQAGLFWGPVSNRSAPTEAGDEFSDVNLNPEVRHGSPNSLLMNVGTIQKTRAIPLDWWPGAQGGGQDNPVIYSQMDIGKNLQVNFNNMGAVVRYDTRWYLPNTLTSADIPEIEIPTSYLRGFLNTYWTYNAATDQLQSVTPPNCPGPTDPNQNVGFTTNYGGVIVSDAAGTRAMGVYGKNVAVGGSVSYYTLWDFRCNTSQTGEFDPAASKMSAVWSPAQGRTAAYRYTVTWLASGTLTDVRQKMRSLYLLEPMGTPPLNSVSAGKDKDKDGDGAERVGSDEPGVTSKSPGVKTRTWFGGPDQTKFIRRPASAK